MGTGLYQYQCEPREPTMVLTAQDAQLLYYCRLPLYFWGLCTVKKEKTVAPHQPYAPARVQLGAGSGSCGSSHGGHQCPLSR